MEISEEKVQAAAEEIKLYLELHGLKYEEIEAALIKVSAWYITSFVEEHDLPRVPEYLKNWGGALQSEVGRITKQRYGR